MHPFIETQKEWMKPITPFRPGDTLRVNVRVKEGDKERVQAFEGVCIARRGGGVSETFTVRKISNGVGVERIFPIHSPMVAEIVVVRRADRSGHAVGADVTVEVALLVAPAGLVAEAQAGLDR